MNVLFSVVLLKINLLTYLLTNQPLMTISYCQGEHRLVTVVLLRIEGNAEKILCLRVVSSCMAGLIPVKFRPVTLLFRCQTTQKSMHRGIKSLTLGIALWMVRRRVTFLDAV